jgi:hypothetical protein
MRAPWQESCDGIDQLLLRQRRREARREGDHTLPHPLHSIRLAPIQPFALSPGCCLSEFFL